MSTETFTYGTVKIPKTSGYLHVATFTEFDIICEDSTENDIDNDQHREPQQKYQVGTVSN